MNRWRIGSVVADDLDADLQSCELRIVEGCDLKSVFATGGEHVCRAIIGLGGAQPLQPGRNAGDEIAAPGIERVANEAAPLGPPSVFEVSMEGLGDDSGDRVLEALLLLVRKGQVVGVSTDAQVSCRCRGGEQQRRRSDRPKEDGTHRGCLPWSS